MAKLPQEQIINIVKTAISEYKRAEYKSKRTPLHNTVLLMKNYNSLTDYLNTAKDSIKDVDDIDQNDINYDEYYINSIRRSKFRTIIIISHIEAAMGLLKRKADTLKFTAFEKYYLGNFDFESIAIELNCSTMTARRWVKEMEKELSVLLFGIEAFKEMLA